MSWKWLTWSLEGIHVVGHIVDEKLVDVVVADIEERAGKRPEKIEDVTEFLIDLPGVMTVGRPIEEFSVLGLRLSVPSEDVGSFISQLGHLRRRGAGDGSYFKLHAFYKAWVLAPAQHKVLLRELMSREAAAEAAEAAFYSKHGAAGALARTLAQSKRGRRR